MKKKIIALCVLCFIVYFASCVPEKNEDGEPIHKIDDGEITDDDI